MHKINRFQHPLLRHAGTTFTNGVKWGTDSRAEKRRYAELSWQKKRISPGEKSELFASLLQFTLASVRKFPSADKLCQGNQARKCVAASISKWVSASEQGWTGEICQPWLHTAGSVGTKPCGSGGWSDSCSCGTGAAGNPCQLGKNYPVARRGKGCPREQTAGLK